MSPPTSDRPPPAVLSPPPRASVHVVPWVDPAVEASGVDPRSAYVELFWLPVLGPTATWLVRRLADDLDTAPEGCDVDLDDVARSLGIGGLESRHGPLRRALRRCARFGLVRPDGPERLAVRRLLGPLPQHHLARLPETLRERHRRWELPSPAGAHRQRARLLALDALGLGEAPADVERRLLGWGVHPALAYESAGWAATRQVVLAGAPAAEPAPPGAGRLGG